MEYALTATKDRGARRLLLRPHCALLRLDLQGQRLRSFFGSILCYSSAAGFSRGYDSRCRLRHRLAHSCLAAFDTFSRLDHGARFVVDVGGGGAEIALLQFDGRKRDVTFTQGNLLCLPFADESLDLVVTSGALEYVPLGDGLT